MICPHCNRKVEIPRIYVEKGYVKCSKCLQIIEIEKNEPKKTIPKELVLKKILIHL